MDITRAERIALMCSVGGWGGQEQNTVKTVAWLRDAGVEITIIAASASRLTTAAREQGLPVITFDHAGKHLVWSDARRLRDLLRQHRITTLIIGHSRHLYISVWAARWSVPRPRLLFWQHVQITMSRRDPYHGWFYQQLDTFITPLDYLRLQALERTTLRSNQIVQIPQVIDTEPLVQSTVPKHEARALLDLPPDVFLVGTIGRIDRAKGQEFLIHAIAQLQRRGTQQTAVHAVIIGENSREDYLGELLQLIDHLGVRHAVHVRDFTPNIQAAFRALDVFAMTSISEPIGMVTLEAMALGIPVIGSNSGGTPELLDHGQAGLLIPPCDATALADAIEWCATNTNEVEALILRGRATVAQRFDRRIQVAAFTELLHSSRRK